MSMPLSDGEPRSRSNIVATTTLEHPINVMCSSLCNRLRTLSIVYVERFQMIPSKKGVYNFFKQNIISFIVDITHVIPSVES